MINICCLSDRTLHDVKFVLNYLSDTALYDIKILLLYPPFTEGSE